MHDIWEKISPYNIILHTELIEPRAYQINIIKKVYSGKNYLIVLPTGLGKTLIAILAIAKTIYEGKKAIILAPTKPLSEQHYNTLKKLLNIDENSILLLTGSMRAKEREERERNSKVIAATPQTVANDLRLGRLSMDDCGVVIFDECHKAVGKYAYTYIADECKLKGIQIIGLTASPGSDRKKINKLIETLGIQDIEIRTSLDADVVQYVMDKPITVEYVEKGHTVTKITSLIKPLIDEHLDKLYKKGMSPFRRYDNMSKRQLLEIGGNIEKIEALNYKYMLLFHYVYAINLAHMHELISTEGIYPFVNYAKLLEEREKKSRAVASLLSDGNVKNAIEIAKSAMLNGEEHPKMFRAVSIIKGLNGKNIIIFAQYRSTIRKLTEMLNLNGISARSFVGKGNGITQNGQQEIIKEFGNKEFSVLVSTSIGEEGLDIPSVDVVIFYEPVASEIRTIQRKGRAGRMKIGQIIILVTRGTKDEIYLMISNVREKRMKQVIEKIRDSLEKKYGSAAMGEGQQKLYK